MDFFDVVDADFSGVISIKQNGRHIFQHASGYADMSNKFANEINTKFQTASAGKVFIATAILSLIEKGIIKFDSAIGDILSFDLKDIDTQITVGQLLNHTSGIPDYFDESMMHDYEELWKNLPNYSIRKSSDLIPFFIDKPMLYPKGERFQYNNTGYVVLGLIIEEIEKIPFDTYIEKYIFRPCDMTATGYYELDRLPAKCAFSYIYDKERNDYRTNIFSIDAKGSGAGGAFTTAADVETFWECLISGKLISIEMLGLMLAPQVKENCYGYGVWLLDGKIPVFQGCDPGTNFFTSYNLEKHLSITILSNMDCNVEAMHKKLYDLIMP